jgi:4-diphosphocytidyl-2-C-methyl-D-erythritol kinase
MVVFPNCKINIGLQVIGKRADGYHDLQTIFYPVPIKDALEIIDDPTINSIEFSFSGITIDEKFENNLCIKAYELIKKDFPALPGMRMHLHKAIPMGAGLGGGSADAAFTLEMINKKYHLNLTHQQLKEYALLLGSDCPYFLINKPCIASGRGEILEDIQLDLSSYKILVVNPAIHINTGWAFSVLDTAGKITDLASVIKKPVSEWREIVFNDFEVPVFNAYPEIRSIKESMYSSGALYAAMSGSGSSVYGIFQKDAIPNLNFPAHYFYRWV